MTDPEISANAEAFRFGLGPKLNANLAAVVAQSSPKLDEAYARLTSLEAWRAFVLEEHMSVEALGFYSEAQNDGLTSLMLISLGLWRPATQALRSLLENVLHCLYFHEHPVEYRLWDAGKFRPTFKELFDYFVAHPDISELPSSLDGATGLRAHYKHLSNIVHASAREFRMTNELENLKLWNTTNAGVGKWAATHKNVLRDVNLLMLPLFAKYLQGAAHVGVRKSLSLAIPAARDAQIKTSLGVKIVR